MLSAFIFVSAISAAAQAPFPSPLPVDSLTASKNLISMPPPVYPMHAKQLHIKGSVALEVSVDASGKVTAVHVVSGPQELQQAAVDAFSHAKYRPFMREANQLRRSCLQR
jgi:TonB family protein